MLLPSDRAPERVRRRHWSAGSDTRLSTSPRTAPLRAATCWWRMLVRTDPGPPGHPSESGRRRTKETVSMPLRYLDSAAGEVWQSHPAPATLAHLRRPTKRPGRPQTARGGITVADELCFLGLRSDAASLVRGAAELRLPSQLGRHSSRTSWADSASPGRATSTLTIAQSSPRERRRN